MRTLKLITAVLATAACGESIPVSITSAQADANPLNPLSALVTVTSAHGGDCARVTYFALSDAVAAATPCRPLAEGSAKVAVLGLLPNTSYRGSVEVWSKDKPVAWRTISFSTGGLPPDLDAHLEVTGAASGGYLLTAVGQYAVAFDGAGRIRWLRAFDDTLVETKQQPNGDFTSYLGSSNGFNGVDGRFLQYAPSGEIRRTWGTPAPNFTDSHELLLSFDASGQVAAAHFFTYQLVGGYGPGVPDRVALHTLVRQLPDGTAQTVYLSGVGPADVIEEPSLTAFPDLDHPNSIDFDADGNYIVSYRNLGLVMKIDARTGAVLWRLGGPASDFTFVNDEQGGFSAQHSARIVGDGRLLLYDNGWRHSPAETRAVEYKLDLNARTATQLWEYRSSSFTPFMGSAQRLASGETLVGLSSGDAVRVDARGNEVSRSRLIFSGEQRMFYRMTAVPSLYEYQKP
jgi:hypothetical protein